MVGFVNPHFPPQASAHGRAGFALRMQMGRIRVVCATSVPNDKRRLLLRRSICLDHRTDVVG
jgi:hypothetical protein